MKFTSLQDFGRYLVFPENRKARLLLVFNLFLLWLSSGLLVSFYPLLPPRVPLFYTHPWGELQLAPLPSLILPPFLGALFLFFNFLLSVVFWRAREKDLALSVWVLSTVVELWFCYSLVRIILISTSGIEFTLSGKVYLASSVACLIAFIVSPLVRRFARCIKAVDDPKRHNHPAVLHKDIIPRAGALAFLISFLVTAILFLPLAKKLIGVYLGTVVAVVLGVLDDRGASGRRQDVNPYLRLGVQILAASCIVAAGVGITFFKNPFGGIARLDTIDIPIYMFGEHHILLLADMFALIWMVWVMNVLSWSNGVDGQFSGVVFITCLVLALLSLRLAPFESVQGQTAVLAGIAGGAALGLLPSTWHPSRILWGFGATACGLIIASLSILSGAKVATAVLILLVPILDAVVAIGRRLLRRQSPVWGDREHLHHHLLDKGFTQRQVAGFYWVLTIVCGALALCTAGRSKMLAILTVGGVVGFLLVLVNLFGSRFKSFSKAKQDQTEADERYLGQQSPGEF